MRAGETARIEVQLVPAVPVDIPFPLEAVQPGWTTIECELRDEAGALMRRGGSWLPTRAWTAVRP